MSHNYGPNVTGWYDPSGRAWEITIAQQNKAAVEKDFNLGYDLAAGGAQSVLRTVLPSGWLEASVVSSTVDTPYFLASTVPNELRFDALRAHVNGWQIPVANTLSIDGSNRLDLGAGPAGAGATRVDLVVLEVWRLVIAPESVDPAGHSALNRIWWNGNVKIDPAQDPVLNFVDDLYDVTLAEESMRRVQIQYRLRVIQGVDLSTYPFGIDDPTVVAHSVPTAPAVPDGVATAYTYSNQSANGDPGLWMAGDGNPANTLGTTDGYMYAIPLCAVFRRNTTAFDRNTNQNGGVADPGPSDRPDGYFYDIFQQRDVMDLRQAVHPSGWDLAELLQKGTNLLLDNNTKTEFTTTVFGGGVAGHTIMVEDEIGLSNGNGGDGIVTGSTSGGPLIGQFDYSRRSFSDRVVYETIVVAIAAPMGGWLVGSTVTIDPTALAVYPNAAFNWASYNPATVQFIEITDAWWFGPSLLKQTANAMSRFTATGMATIPVSSVTLTMVSLPGALSDETLYVTLVVAYPSGQGLTRTPTADYGADSFTVNNPIALPVDFNAFAATNHFDAPHREVVIQYTTTPVVWTVRAQAGFGPVDNFPLPERAYAITSVLKNAVPIVGGVVLDDAGRVATFTNPVDFTLGIDVLTVTYTALRPIPQSGMQMALYYEARAPQTVRGSLLGTSVEIIPKLVGSKVWMLLAGSGSFGEAYPMPTAYVQMGGVFPSTSDSFLGDHTLDGPVDWSMANFTASTGLATLEAVIPYVPPGEAQTFTRGVGDTDAEGRTFFPSVPGGNYLPNQFATGLTTQLRHRNMVPMIAELATDTSWAPKGTLVLVFLMRHAVFDADNHIAFDSDLTISTSSLAIYRLKGNPLTARA